MYQGMAIYGMRNTISIDNTKCRNAKQTDVKMIHVGLFCVYVCFFADGKNRWSLSKNTG